MNTRIFLSALLATTIAGISSANAQAFVIDEPFVPPPVLAAPAPVVVPAPPQVVVVRRAPAVIVRPAPLVAPEPIVVAPGVCAYGYAYC